MIEINLLPGAGKKRSARRQPIDLGAAMAGLAGRVRDKFLVGTVAASLLAIGGVGAMYFLQSRREANLTQHMEQAVRDSTRYATVVRDRLLAEAVRDTLLREVNLIKTLDEDRFIWSHVMDEVSRALPQYTWLTLVAYTGTPQGSANNTAAPKMSAADSAAAKKKRKRLDTEIPKDSVHIRLMGRTVDIQALTRFMRDLEASPFLSGVTLDKSELALDQGKEVTQFQLTVAYSRPDTAFLRRNPLSLTGR
jgi:type IV pilus assembly protein PilN